MSEHSDDLSAGFRDSSLPEIRTAFYIKDGKMRIFRITGDDEDWTTNFEEIATNYPPEMLLENYAGFVPIDIDTSGWIEKPEFETLYVAPEAIEYVTLYDKNPDIIGEVMLAFDPYKNEENHEILRVPVELKGPDFIKVLLKPHTDNTDQYDGWYYFHRARFAEMMKDKEWASGYAICTADYIERLQEELGVRMEQCQASQTYEVPDGEEPP